MFTRAIILLSVFFLLSYFAFAQDYQHFFSEAKKALSDKQYQEFYTLINKAHELHPYHQTILWYAGMAAALTGRPDEAISYLTKAININAGYNLGDSNLNALKKDPGFQQLIQTRNKLNQPLIHSDTAYVIQDRQLHLESVAFDPVEKTLYGGSIHKRKIIKVNSGGVVSDLTRPEQYGLGSVFGLRVDAKKRILWACSAAIPEMQHYDSTIAPALFQFDIKTGRLVGSFSPVDTVHKQMFGDLVLNSKGTPYVSDSRNNIIYTYDADRGELLPFFSSKEFWSIQGLCFSDDDNVLYIADYIKGIFMLEVKTMKLSKVNAPYDLSLKGTDGILFYKNSLITIQNGVQPNRVVRHFLSKGGNTFIRYEYIDNAHPAFGEPTIGSLPQNTLFYVANSQWTAYENGSIKGPAELHPIVILKYVLKE
jgi:tetratricopeptide (TPR) repeat protein